MFIYSYKLFLGLLSAINCEHQPRLGAPSFLRSSVESIPHNVVEKNEALTSAVYGETSLPLRSAVESIPSIGLVVTR